METLHAMHFGEHLLCLSQIHNDVIFSAAQALALSTNALTSLNSMIGGSLLTAHSAIVGEFAVKRNFIFLQPRELR